MVEALVRATRAIAEPELRAAYLRSVLASGHASAVAHALDALCARAEQADPAAREVLVAIVDALQHPSLRAVVERLRRVSSDAGLLALGRLIRSPAPAPPPAPVASDPEDERVPDYGRGRPLTLGERKSLARRPDRSMTERLLRDPHPDVIRQLLANTKLTEDDVLSLASRRPCRPDVLLEIARTPRWAHRPRIRRALVLNPDTPGEAVAPLVALLIRQELELVASSTTVAPAVRALCHEHLARRPPSPVDGARDELQ